MKHIDFGVHIFNVVKIYVFSRQEAFPSLFQALIMIAYFSIILCLAVYPVNNVSFRESSINASPNYKHEVRSKGQNTPLNQGDRIFHGDDAAKGEFPYVVAVMRLVTSDRGRYRDVYCAGSLVQPGTVLTACHCLLQDKLPDEMKATKLIDRNILELSAGGIEVSEYEFENGESQLRLAKSLKIHPWCYVNETFVSYDMGIIEPDYAFVLVPGELELVPLTNYPNHDFVDSLIAKGTHCMSMGWGLNERLETPEILQKMEVVLREPEWCAKEVYEHSKDGPLGPDHFDQNIHICASGIVDNQTSCWGDSGSPLMCSVNGTTNMTIVGTLSYGPGSKPCGKTGIPAVFARIEIFDDLPFTPKSFAVCLSPGSSSIAYVGSFVVIHVLVDFSS